MNDAQKTIAGLLVIGASVLSADATLLATAGGIGVNWTAEGLAGLWQRQALDLAPGTPLSRAYQRAIQRALRDLRKEFISQTGRSGELAAFDLLADCADAVSQAQYPAGDLSVEAAQRALAGRLGELLYGHDPRQVEFLQRRLLDAVALAFRAELAADEAAWRRFHGWLIEQLAAGAGSLGQSVERVSDVLEQLRSAPVALEALKSSSSRIEDMLGEVLRRLDAPPPPSTTSAAAPAAPQVVLNFNNQGMRARDVYQGQTLNINQPASEAQEGHQEPPMSMQLPAADFERLVAILSAQPDFRTEQGRVDFIADVLRGSPRKADLDGLLSFSGTQRAWAIRTVERLAAFGQDLPGRAVLGLLIEKLLIYIGSGPDADFLRGLSSRQSPPADDASAAAPPATTPALSAGKPVDILTALKEHFNLVDLRTMSYRLGADPDNIVTGSKDAAALELVQYMQRRNRLPDLVAEIRRARGNIL